MRLRKLVALACLSTMLITGCGTTSSTNSSDSQNTEATQDTETEQSESSAETTVSTTSVTTEGIDVALTGDYSEKAIAAEWDESSSTNITLSSSSITIDGEGATESDNVVTISQSGTYVLSGTISDGQIVVDLTEDENVQIVLNGVDITCTTSAPIVAWNAKNLYITLADGTENTITDNREAATDTTSTSSTETTDSDSEDTETDDPTAAIYSKCDLFLNGSGSLTVTANYKDGITSKDDLQIIDGTITISAADDGIVGKDSLYVRAGTIDITSVGDGLKSSNSEDTTKGNVVIDGGTISINSSDDGIHSESVLVINDGTLTISNSYEGLESLNIVINGGTIDITSSDDGINITDGSSSSSDTMGGFSGGTGSTDSSTTSAQSMSADSSDSQTATTMSSTTTTSESSGSMHSGGGHGGNGGGGGGMDTAIDGGLLITGGTLTVNAEGDGLDSNGSIAMTGGTVIVYGPQGSGNGSLDYNGSFTVTGGSLYIIGSSGMAQYPSSDSTQSYVAGTFNSSLSAGTTVEVTDSEGNVLYSAESVKSFNQVVVCTAEIEAGASYTVTAGSESVSATAE